MIKAGSGDFVYGVKSDWAKLPEGWKFTQVAGIITDADDRVYVFNRGEHPVIIFDRYGNFIKSWGEGMFNTPHGICLTPDGYVYLADSGNHTVRKFDTDGRLVMTLGTKDMTGTDGKPFNKPTDVSVSPSGDIYVSDGYGNSRVHKFSPDGKLIMSWGTAGDGEGQFNLPHGIFIYKSGDVYVADRQNHRIQIFTADGEFIGQWRADFRQPCNLFIDADDNVYIPELQHRMTIMSLSGEITARWGEQESHDPGQFVAPHTACTDSHGDLYVGEVLEGQRVQKFVLCFGYRIARERL